MVLLQSSSHGQGPRLSWSTGCTDTYYLYVFVLVFVFLSVIAIAKAAKVVIFLSEMLIENGDIGDIINHSTLKNEIKCFDALT